MALSFQDKIKTVPITSDKTALSFADKIKPMEDIEKPGIVQSIAQTIASPFLRVLANVGAIGESISGLETAGLQAITGKKEEAKKTIFELATQPRQEFDFGYLGKVKTIETPKEAIGVGAEIASTLLPVGKAGQIAKLTLGGKVLKGLEAGAKIGAVSGGLSGAGQALQEDLTPKETFYNAAISAGIGGVLGGTLGATAPVAGKLYQKFAEPYEQRISNTIKDYYSKAIKPSITGKLTKEAAQRYDDNTIKGVSIIANNKNNLILGERKGVLPESVSDFSEAISQAKKGVFDSYNSLTKATGLTGNKIDLKPIADELDKIANDIGLQDNFPQIVVYAEQKAQKLRARGSYDPETAERVISEYNSALKNFYKNPNYESATKVRIDALAVNRLRKSLDYLIENTTGAEYQEIKSYYGALKAIESDVNRAAIRVANRNIKGIIDLSDIFSAGDIIGGIATLDPTFFVKGIVQKGVAAWYKNLNSPDNLIKKMFLNVDNNITKIKSGKIPPITKATKITKEILKDESGTINLGAKVGLNKTSNPINGESKLLQEAKKFKSAEEFVKAQGETIYHGTAGKFDMFDDSMKGSVTGAKSAHGATWFTNDPAVAKAYSIYAAESGPINKLLKEQTILEKIAQKSGKNSDWAKVDTLTQKIDDLGGYDATYERRVNASVKEAIAKGDFYKVDAKGKTPQELSADGDIDSWLNLQVEKAKKFGKDGLIIKNIDDAVGLYNKSSTHYAIFDAKNIITKKQLIDIWNKANNK